MNEQQITCKAADNNTNTTNNLEFEDLRKQVLAWPNESLRVRCDEIEEITPEIETLAQHMLDTMYASHGCGLAAPQIGERLRMIVIDVDYVDPEDEKNPFVLINPEIVVKDGPLRSFNEGCLSFPGISVEIERPSHVVVEAYNLDGDLMQYEAENNLLCVCLQHEIDHINGITMIDHLNTAERAEKIQELKEALARGAQAGDVG